jgi:membrane protease YdiL (CAAX protease family)
MSINRLDGLIGKVPGVTDKEPGASMEQNQPAVVSKRDDPRYDARRVVVYFLGLIAFYAAVVAVMRPGEGEISKVALGVMFAPTVGAIAAVLFAHGRIQFGRLTKHIFLAFLPPLVIMLSTWAVSLASDVSVHPEKLLTVVLMSPVFALFGAMSAIGEEIGWRGFLWPLFRRHMGFWISSLVMLPIWWLYHLPAVLFWGYGSVGGLLAFTVAITGFILFVGVLTDRSRAIWPSVLAHGAWNGMVAKAYYASLSGEAIPACRDGACPDFAGDGYLFTGPQSLLGEFGWIAAVTMLLLGLAAGWWHMRHPKGADAPEFAQGTRTNA